MPTKKQSDIKEKKKTKFKDFEANCKFFFTHVNEWSNDSDQVEQVKLVTVDKGKIEKSFESYE